MPVARARRGSPGSSLLASPASHLPVVRVPVCLFAMLFALSSGVGVGGCRSSRPGAASDSRGAAAVGSPKVLLHAGTRTIPFRVELATTEPQRERGLMYRNRLDPDAGMLFVFERDAPLTFWMKNTLIPLDMIFIDGQRHIVGIVENAEPETLSPRGVEGLSRYVLEVAGGTTRRLGIAPGSSVGFEGMPPELSSN